MTLSNIMGKLSRSSSVRSFWTNSFASLFTSSSFALYNQNIINSQEIDVMEALSLVKTIL